MFFTVNGKRAVELGFADEVIQDRQNVFTNKYLFVDAQVIWLEDDGQVAIRIGFAHDLFDATCSWIGISRGIDHLFDHRRWSNRERV